MPAEDLWIESHVGMSRHPKTKRLKRLLDDGRPEGGHDCLAATVGHMHILWHYAMEQEAEGTLSKYDDDEIADLAGWKGDPKVFVDGIRAVGFLDDDGQLHNWWDYAEKWLARRKVSREKQAAHREKLKAQATAPPVEPAGGDVTVTASPPVVIRHDDVTGNVPVDIPVDVNSHVNGVVPVVVPSDVTVTSPLRHGETVPNLTGPNRTKPNRTDEGGAAPAAPTAPDPGSPGRPHSAPPATRRDLVRMDEILTPLRSKGFAASRDFWAKVNERYPLLDLELEALKIVDWLGMPKNAKTRCTLIRVINWLDKAEVDRKQREVDLQAARIAGVPGGGHAPGTNGTARPYVPNLNPEADLPVWDEQKAKASDAGKEEGRRLLEERRRAAAAAAASRPRPQTRSA